MNFLVHTDFGHDPDDAIALAFLIEHGYIPKVISITPGAWEQKCALTGFLESYLTTSWLLGDIDLIQPITKFEKTLNVGKHSIFNANMVRCFFPMFEPETFDNALVIGPAKELGDKLICDTLYFQGGYSPNSVAPLAKFEGMQAVQSFNPSGAKKDFNLLLETPTIGYRYYIGKNVCHGFTKHHLKKMWEPKNPLVRKFWNQLAEYKAMHDVVAAMIFVNKDFGIWEQAKPIWIGNKMTTIPTTEEIYTLIGLKL